MIDLKIEFLEMIVPASMALSNSETQTHCKSLCKRFAFLKIDNAEQVRIMREEWKESLLRMDESNPAEWQGNLMLNHQFVNSAMLAIGDEYDLRVHPQLFQKLQFMTLRDQGLGEGVPDYRDLDEWRAYLNSRQLKEDVDILLSKISLRYPCVECDRHRDPCNKCIRCAVLWKLYQQMNSQKSCKIRQTTRDILV
jgi:hypothetical protein